MSDKEYDVIIIGGGPAGYSAGLYTTRACLKTLLIESYTVLSQLMLTDFVENYPGFPEGIKGFELNDNIKKQAQKFGLEIKDGFVENIKRVNALYVFAFCSFIGIPFVFFLPKITKKIRNKKIVI